MRFNFLLLSTTLFRHIYPKINVGFLLLYLSYFIGWHFMGQILLFRIFASIIIITVNILFFVFSASPKFANGRSRIFKDEYRPTKTDCEVLFVINLFLIVLIVSVLLIKSL